MPQSPEVGVVFGISPASNARLRDLLGRFSSLDGVLRLETEAKLAAFAHRLSEDIKHEFIAGGHDRTGRDDDPSLWKSGYQHAVDTIEVNVHGLEATIQMGGGAVFVEYGSRPHIIEATNGPWLEFKGSEGWARVEAVNHPGYRGDDFMGRGIKKANAFDFLSSIISSVQVETWGHAENKRGEQYIEDRL